MQLGQIMTSPAVSCRQRDTLEVAAKLMWDYDCGAVPVTDEEGRLVGIVTDRDACMAAYTRGLPLRAIPVSDAMAHDIASLAPEDSLETAERLMSVRQIRRVPIVDRDLRPIGVVTLSDIARHAISPRARRYRLDRGLAQTLAAISQPRMTLAPSFPESDPPAPSL